MPSAALKMGTVPWRPCFPQTRTGIKYRFSRVRPTIHKQYLPTTVIVSLGTRIDS